MPVAAIISESRAPASAVCATKPERREWGLKRVGLQLARQKRVLAVRKVCAAIDADREAVLDDDVGHLVAARDRALILASYGAALSSGELVSIDRENLIEVDVGLQVEVNRSVASCARRALIVRQVPTDRSRRRGAHLAAPRECRAMHWRESARKAIAFAMSEAAVIYIIEDDESTRARPFLSNHPVIAERSAVGWMKLATSHRVRLIVHLSSLNHRMPTDTSRRCK
jgi:hypothetical protein